MTNVLELSADESAQPMYALTLPLSSAISELPAELQTEFLQNQIQVSTDIQTEFLQNELQAIQSLVNQSQQNHCDEISNYENLTESADAIEEIGEEEELCNGPVYSADQNALDIQALNIVQTQSMLNGISNEIIEYMIEEDEDHIETIEQKKDQNTSYTICLNGKQYDFKLVPTAGENGIHNSQLKILLSASNKTEEIDNTDEDAVLSAIQSIQESQKNIYDDEISDIAVLVQAYKCRECYFTIEDRHLLIEHYKNEHMGKVPKVKQEYLPDAYNLNKLDIIERECLLYMCCQCSQGFNSIEECKIHMIEDHNLVGKDCEPDDITPKFENEYDLCSSPKLDDFIEEESKESYWLSIKCIKELKSILMSDWKNKCTVNCCPYRFKDNDSLENHLKCHVASSPLYKDSSRKLFSCMECGNDYPNWRTCSFHLWRDHLIDVDMLTCPICNEYKTLTAVKLSHHMKIHGTSRDFVCNECGKAFKQSGQLHNHKVIHRSRRKTQLQRWYTAKNCDICLKSFANTKCLKKHIQAMHSKIRPFICNVCGHSSARKAMLQLHLRQHTGEKPYACTECEYRTSDHNTLRRHVMRHTGVRPYNCPYCPYAAIQSIAFKTHMKNKHDNQPGIFICKDCPFMTVNQKMYESHVSDHERGLVDRRKGDMSNSMDRKLHSDSENGRDIYAHKTSRMMYRKRRESIQNSLNLDNTSTEKSVPDSEDEDTQHCFLTRRQNIDNSEEAIDTGGVTIPADI